MRKYRKKTSKNQNFCILFYTFVANISRLKTMRYLLCFMLTLLAAGCTTNDNRTNQSEIYVTIAPLRAVVEEVTCHDFDVEILVPKGAGPETFEPTAKQLTALSNAEFVFSTGLITFEQHLTESVSEERLVDLSRNITLIEGSCSHGHHHSHGVDPHIWTSPRALKTMTLNIRDAIMERYPDSAKYATAAEELIARLDSLDDYCRSKVEESEIKSMMIYHPAYTYYARDYGIDQIAIEHDGKEPTPKRLTALSDRAKRDNIGVILLQPQYSIDKVRPIAQAAGAEVVIADPLSEDIEGEIRRITDIICK